MSNYYERQNHQQALTYLRAAHYCEKKKNRLTYRMIILPVLLTLLSIVNGNLSRIIPDPETVEILGYSLSEFSDMLAKTIIIVSGVLIIYEVFVNIKVRRLDLEKCELFGTVRQLCV